MAATELTHAPLPGLPTPQLGENRLHPLATELYRGRDSFRPFLTCVEQHINSEISARFRGFTASRK